MTDFITSNGAHILWDIGCNTGEYSEVALAAGAKSVVGFDFDQLAIDRAYKTAKSKNLNLLPLFLDATNPSPNQGWLQKERKGLIERRNADAIMALALVHHLSIARNIPIEAVVVWLVSLSEQGLVEFVPKSDPMVQALLRHRKDIFPEYNIDTFRDILKQNVDIQAEYPITDSDRVIFHYIKKS